MSIPTENKEKIYFNAFNLTGDIGSVRFRKLLNHFSSLEDAWRADSEKLTRSGLEPQIVKKITEKKQTIDPETEYEKLTDHNISLITINEKSYPKQLKEIPSPPACLYIHGTLSSQDSSAVSIVGSRKFSPYGKRVTEELARDLIRSNVTVVSGLALGIDSIAHRTSVEYEGRTLAVLACGLDSIYPASNRVLGEKIIADHGALISELPLGTPPLKHHFPSRNRIISGLTLGTVVVEAAAESGALITARHALEQNRQVFAVPGSIYNPSSAGPNNLIKMGAIAVTCAADILEDLNLDGTQEQLITENISGDNDTETSILTILSKQPVHIDQIIKQLKLSSSTVAATLTILEMKGKVKNLGANQYVLGR